MTLPIVRTISVCLFIGLVVTFTSSARADGPKSTLISRIRKECTLIERDASKYRRLERPCDGMSAEGGLLTAYYEGKSLRKLVVKLYGESGKSTIEFYVHNGMPLFILRTDMEYKRPIGPPPFGSWTRRVIRTVQSRYYLDRGRLIGYSRSSKAAFQDHVEPQRELNSLLDIVKDLRGSGVIE
jgi:hypothetical protein